MAEVKLNIEELKGFLEHIITNNRHLQAEGKVPVAVEVVGDSGIGKTSSLLQLTSELGMDMVKLNLAQIEELGDLIGFPIRQYQVCKEAVIAGGDLESKCEWIDEHAVDNYRSLGYTFTGKNRMSYCPPEWIADKSAGGVLLLDDWNRADVRFIQAVMELVDRQTYISWKLPKDWHILLSANPDNGDYMVSSIDNAQKTRFISADLKFDIQCWGRWAEQNGIDSRCINFLIMHPELVTTKCNPRSITTFFNAISSISDFEKNLPLIQMIGEGSVGEEFSTLFTLFINNRLDRLITPHNILFGDEAETLKSLVSSIGTGDKYRGDIASVLGTRIVNYAIYYAVDNSVDKKLIDRIALLINKDIFTNDLKYNIVKGIVNGNQVKYRLLTMNKDLQKYVLA